MGTPNAVGDWLSEMEVSAFRRLFPLRYYERHLSESIRPDARPLKRARDTIVSLGAVASSDGSVLAKIGSTTMLATIKMEVMTPPNHYQSGDIGFKSINLDYSISSLYYYCLDSSLSLYFLCLDSLFRHTTASIMETFMTVVLNSSGQLVSLYKPGGQRRKELQEINEAISTMEID
ncbi:hypothetical protein ACJRO7_000053 [Eucalyptus globulus]|uniref:Ribosomal RNA-processing protein 43 n=1 Tax=Eucalyptus globulus TaxID=34317 RepID=A0ABD3LL98_EUCGL